MKAIFYILILCVVSCGKQEPDFGPFGSFVNTFKDAAQERNHPLEFGSLVMRFGTIEDTQILAFCRGSNEIVIDQAKWNRYPNEHYTLVFHELGHCVLHRGHRDDTNQEVRGPASIMNSHVVHGEQFDANRNYYLNELMGVN